jgi:hypothetical protein
MMSSKGHTHIVCDYIYRVRIGTRIMLVTHIVCGGGVRLET